MVQVSDSTTVASDTRLRRDVPESPFDRRNAHRDATRSTLDGRAPRAPPRNGRRRRSAKETARGAPAPHRTAALRRRTSRAGGDDTRLPAGSAPAGTV